MSAAVCSQAVRPSVATGPDQLRRFVHRHHPDCVVCGFRIAEDAAGSVIVVEGLMRLAHTRGCYDTAAEVRELLPMADTRALAP